MSRRFCRACDSFWPSSFSLSHFPSSSCTFCRNATRHRVASLARAPKWRLSESLRRRLLRCLSPAVRVIASFFRFVVDGLFQIIMSRLRLRRMSHRSRSMRMLRQRDTVFLVCVFLDVLVLIVVRLNKCNQETRRFFFFLSIIKTSMAAESEPKLARAVSDEMVEESHHESHKHVPLPAGWHSSRSHPLNFSRTVHSCIDEAGPVKLRFDEKYCIFSSSFSL